MECEGAHSVRGQLHCVQQSDLNEAVGLSATDWPVLIALHLQKDRQDRVQGCLETSKGSGGKRAGVPGQKQWGGLAYLATRTPRPKFSDPLCHPSNHIRLSCYVATPALVEETRAIIEIYLFMTRYTRHIFCQIYP